MSWHDSDLKIAMLRGGSSGDPAWKIGSVIRFETCRGRISLGGRHKMVCARNVNWPKDRALNIYNGTRHNGE